MINLKIKTLDSRDHDFEVADDITVRQFKEHIVTKVGIAAEVQRLIYCGRVLVDDKPLNEYNVNGKVVHLVERQPPRTRPETRSEPSLNRRLHQQHHQHHHMDVHAQPVLRTIDGMVMGAVAIPYNPLSPTNASPMNPSSTLCMNRITVARHMLTCVQNIVNFLDNPELGLNNADLDILAQHTLESTVFENGMTNIAVTPPTATSEQSPVVAATTITLSGTRESTPVTVTADATPPPTPSFAEPTAVPPRPEPTPAPGAARTRTQSERSTTSTRTPSSTIRTGSASGSSTPTGQNRSANASPSRRQTTSPSVLAEVVQQMRTVQTRMEPYIQQYYDILVNDPRFTTDEQRTASQRVFDRISEALHYMSHAQHAISDLMLDLSQEPARHLSCRPILVEQSAYQSLIPIPRRVGIINGVMSLNNGAGNNNETAAPNNNAPTGPQMVQVSVQMPTVPMSTMPPLYPIERVYPNLSTEPTPQPTAGARRATPPSTQAPAPNTPAAAAAAAAAAAVSADGDQQVSIGRLIQGIVNSVSLYSDFQLDMDLGVLGDGGLLEAPANDAPSAAGATTTTAATTPVTMASSTSTSRATRQRVPLADPPGTRVSAATFPTTSTQTRSTARPHVHVHSLPAAMRQFQATPSMQFDRFLPCTSHHVRENQEAHRQQLVHVHRRTPVRRAYTAGTNMNLRSHSLNNSPLSFANAHPTIALTDLQTPLQLFNGSFSILDMDGLIPQVSTLNLQRDAFRRYVVDTFGDCDETTLAQRIYERVADIIRTSNLREADERPDPARLTGAVQSINNLLRHSIPEFINVLMTDVGSPTFGERIIPVATTFFRRMYVLAYASAGQADANQFITSLVTNALAIANRRESSHVAALLALLERTIRCNQRHVRSHYADVQQFFVIPLGAPDSTATPMDTDESVSTASTPATVASSANREQPQTSSTAPATRRRSPSIRRACRSDAPPPRSHDPEPLPAVVYGTEAWHNALPAAWVPTITRDLARQRRTSAPATPNSDAYLSGMSSKRRKVIASSRPAANNPTALFNQGIRTVCQNRNASTAGSSRSTATAVEDSAASQPFIFDPNGPLERAFREYAELRARNDPDYNPERYPFINRWLSKRQ